MIDGDYIVEMNAIRKRLFELFNSLADDRDDANRMDKPQLRAVAAATEKSLAAVDEAIRKAKL